MLNKLQQNDPLQEGARRMLAAAIDAEVSGFIKRYDSLRCNKNKAIIVRNGYLPARSIQTTLGEIEG